VTFKSSRVLSTQLSCRSVRTTENDRTTNLPATHGQHFGGGVKDLIQRQYSEVPGHKFNHRTQAVLSSINSDCSKSKFSNRRIDNAFWTKLIQHSLAHFISTIVFGYFLSHKEYPFITAKLLLQGFS